jgi:uncharacterized membrane protein
MDESLLKEKDVEALEVPEEVKPEKQSERIQIYLPMLFIVVCALHMTYSTMTKMGADEKQFAVYYLFLMYVMIIPVFGVGMGAFYGLIHTQRLPLMARVAIMFMWCFLFAEVGAIYITQLVALQRIANQV